jgi:biopolymer transport protein TolR
MAMDVGTGNRGGRRLRQMSDINVTPFVDVMLVLLIVFMVTAPLLTVGVQVDLPQTSANAVPGNDEPLAVSVNAAGKVFLMESEIEVSELAPKLTAIAKGATDRRIFVRGDKAIDYGRVMEVMGVIQSAGFTRVALVTVVPNSSGSAPARR